ncbi:hypothetical protein [Spiroplasma ixodetis]|uniref:hypothetical protein n=1 Tax=Spiroplasma ixodetis TaxID=2141 RepID=UPI0025751C21|nr:hypothetical protein [Spiroplasma ixodetis]WJG71432.1 hypothetical protein SIXOD_v1c28770 [Spiroplasma ixodetis Y32]
MSTKNNPWLNETLNEAQEIVREIKSATMIKQNNNENKNFEQYAKSKYTYFTVNHLDRKFLNDFKNMAKEENLSYAKFLVKIFDEYKRNKKY